MNAQGRANDGPERARSGDGEFPPGGFTPVFNEISILLAMSPDRPDSRAGIEDVDGPAERVLMQNVIDESTGVVQPTIFIRSDTFVDPNRGRNTQVLSLAVDSGVGISRILGGEFSVHVKTPGSLPREARRHGLPESAADALRAPLVGGRAVTPKNESVGTIQSLTPDSYFPARVAIPVHYSFVTGGPDRNLATISDNLSTEAAEPHLMEAIVNSIPPDPETVLSAREWNLVDQSGLLKLWIRVEGFRFLGLGDWEHKERLTYQAG